MTREEILNIPAGRELDELIITKIISTDGFWHGVKSYSTDIAAAWQVVEKLKDKGYRIHLSYAGNVNPAHVTLDHDKIMLDVPYWIEAETVPLAICRAALLALTESA